MENPLLLKLYYLHIMAGEYANKFVRVVSAIIAGFLRVLDERLNGVKGERSHFGEGGGGGYSLRFERGVMGYRPSPIGRGSN